MSVQEAAKNAIKIFYCASTEVVVNKILASISLNIF